jgi:5-methylcytosine-specific restriction enzyme A
MENYILKKAVDWSALKEGFSIPVTFQLAFYKQIQKSLKYGDKLSINLIINNKSYPARLINQPFSREKYPRHKDILQIKYSKAVSDVLRKIFYKSYNYLKIQRENKNKDDVSIISVSEELQEFLVIYSSNSATDFVLDFVTIDDRNKIEEEVKINSFNEIDAERFLNEKDNTAGYKEVHRLQKVRRLNRALGNSLKELYDSKCQICGTNFGAKYKARIVECHHIIPFVESINNDSDNLLITCPNHHRIIHKANPAFNRKKELYLYPNGLEEKLLINKHL